MNSMGRLSVRDMLGIASICGGPAALVAGVVSGQGHFSFNLLVSAIVFFISCPFFVVLAFVLTLLFSALRKLTASTLVRWSFFVSVGGGLGLLLSLSVGLLVALVPSAGLAGGLLCGVGCAWLWGYVENYRIRFPIETEAGHAGQRKPGWLSESGFREGAK